MDEQLFTIDVTRDELSELLISLATRKGRIREVLNTQAMSSRYGMGHWNLSFKACESVFEKVRQAAEHESVG